ncbi:MAG: gamma-glutamylcyclotransferase (GGCT)/AIG2-like uncharacterized protein YtfP [Desulforhopalus sp.]|jgi:gamma-glutamylcyclotransferase (GGCT)/AIG2-like uncharacterized protein YtfP
MTNLFTYGSLMCDDIMLHVSGERPSHQKARLNGFFCSQIHGETYPGIYSDVEHNVEGVLYFDVSQSALARLDCFEGEYYQRNEITVLCSSQGKILATAYIIKPQYSHLLTGKLWNYEEFLRHGKKEFEAKYVGFKRCNRM